MAPNRVLIRVEGNDTVGHGHFMRCLTIARYLQQDFECVFAMSTTSDWVGSQLNEYNLPVIDLPHHEQFHPDDSQSAQPWTFDLEGILQTADILILDGYRFDSTFHEAAKRIGAKTIRIIDDLKGPAHCDAVITQLPIAHSEIQAKLGINDAWTGLDGFLVRPEFYAAQKIEIPLSFDFFIYVTTPASFAYYSTLPALRDKKVFAVTSRAFADQGRGLNWEVAMQISAEEMAKMMNSAHIAILPASSIAVEFLTTTGRPPFVRIFTENQSLAFETFTRSRLFLDSTFLEQKENLKIEKTSSIELFHSTDLINWLHVHL